MLKYIFKLISLDFLNATFKETRESFELYKLKFLERKFSPLIKNEFFTKIQINKKNLTDHLEQDIVSELIKENILIQEGNYLILSNKTIINSLK